ncbi:YkgJ family cysteine cluster protein [Myxococcus sp. K15C18031901]|uniref:YkgJ family cysteine cluster protein n=1 Tax=Myxococcus dinghuensis TaxID=2906761 RepID=UPI0020A7FABE|nr:YkgJ family cysteine cluster protein [Myxococcus dinghuensis]MCP3102552.1 YkgJ family cysteine cluster protein [Myxococcus dinghuensis]
MPLSTLCLHCGMCCDGTLFTHVSLQPTEVLALQQRGVPVGQRADGSPALVQHCAALDGRACTAYAERPAGCRRYQCQLYGALAEKEVSLEEALAVVDEAHALRDALERELPSAERDAPRSVMQRARHAAPALSERAQAAYTRAEAFLDARFRGRFGRRG